MCGELIEEKCVQPTFLLRHPIQLSPLVGSSKPSKFLILIALVESQVRSESIFVMCTAAGESQ